MPVRLEKVQIFICVQLATAGKSCHNMLYNSCSITAGAIFSALHSRTYLNSSLP